MTMMLPLDYNEFENILRKVFEPGGRYVGNPSEHTYRLELTKEGQSITIFYDVPANALIEMPQYYHACSITLRQRDDSGIIWEVNILDGSSDVFYEFHENIDGVVGEGREIRRIAI